ncbi:hypothetical protein AVEN_227763-1 [Araneus ventricosus]|uniref:Uncharacterized protein n=1 Tax=Araneus ventricosus TaxID=182803 RepID=A0A4Y2IXA6_ARAVE|nr:hypothetical protein AVEN_227763-1 [Araneus ventricosus]
MASDHLGTIMDLFIELKNEFAFFWPFIYNKVDGFSKLLCPSADNIQSDEPLSSVSTSLQQEIFEAEVKSKVSTYASVAQSTSALPESQSKVISRVVQEKKTNSKVVLNGAGKDSNLEIVVLRYFPLASFEKSGTAGSAKVPCLCGGWNKASQSSCNNFR